MDNEITQVHRPPPPLPDSLRVGEAIGELVIGRHLTNGFSGAFFEATHRRTGKKCVAKLLRTGMRGGPVWVGRLSHDALRASRLSLPGIVGVFRVDRSAGGRAVVLQETVEGADLRSLIVQQGPFSIRRAVPVMKALSRALVVAHAAGVFHRRLHAGNIMIRISREGETLVTVLDFGIWHVHPRIDDASVQRTPDDAACLAPEIARGQDGDHRSDVYSVCCLLYQMLSGKPPFLGQTYAETLELHASETITPTGDLGPVPPQLEQIVMRGLEKDSRKRLPSMEALWAMLDPLSVTVTGQQPIVSRPQIRALVSEEYRIGPAAGSPPGMGSPAPPALPSDVGEGSRARVAVPMLSDAPPPSPRTPVLEMLSPVPLPLPLTPLSTSGEIVATLRPNARRWLFIGLGTGAAIVGAVLMLLLGDGQDEALPTPPATSAPSPSQQPVTSNPRRMPAPQRSATAPAPPPPSSAPNHRALEASVAPDDRGRRPMIGLGQVRRAFGSIVVTAPHPNARIYVDGKLSGAGQNQELQHVPVGAHEVTIDVNGVRSTPRRVEVKAGEKVLVAF